VPEHLLIFLTGSIIVTVVPGADMALITRQVVAYGRRAAHATILGNLAGICFHGAALAVGLSTLLVASANAYAAVKLAGAAYLAYLGVQSLRQARRTRAAAPDTARSTQVPAASRHGSLAAGTALRQGLISTVLNPKPALFFLSFLPQFVDRHHAVAPQVVFLAAVHVVVGLVWLTTYAALVARLSAAIARPRVKAALERATGVVLVALGIRVALADR